MRTEHEIEEELVELARQPVDPPPWYRVAGELSDRRDRLPRVRWRLAVAGAAMTVLIAPAVAEALSPGVVERRVIEPISDILPWVRDEPRQIDVPRADTDVPVTDKKITDVPITDEPITDQVPSDQAPTDQAPTDQAPSDVPVTDEPVHDEAPLTDETDEADDNDQPSDSGSDQAPVDGTGGSDQTDGSDRSDQGDETDSQD